MSFSDQNTVKPMEALMLFFLALCTISCMNDNNKTIDENKPEVQPVETKRVAIQPLSYKEDSISEIIKSNIELFYGFNAEILPEKPLPSSAFYSEGNRYRADSLIRYLAREKTNGYNYIMGVTSKDISCTKGQYEDWGIFGLGYRPGPSCIVSTYRLKRGNPAPAHFRERVIKVALHELGHNLGLPHCPTKDCMMQDAKGTIVTVDTEKMQLCSSCKEKIGKK